MMHLRCARNIQALLPKSNRLSAEQTELVRFFCAYFAEHETFARTAYDLLDPGEGCGQWFLAELGLDMTVIDSLMGCSRELMSLISQISDLADEWKSLQDVVKCQPSGDGTLQEKFLDLQARRCNIERRLHGLQQTLPSRSTGLPFFEDDPTATQELKDIAEARRLSALVYLYSRIDGVAPACAPIDRITSQILALIPKISLRSHALLWTLFVVGTMGIGVSDRNNGDADRAFILEKLVSLERTRRLRNVGKAREVVEVVWKMRDLREPYGLDLGGWEDIAGCHMDSYGLSLC